MSSRMTAQLVRDTLQMILWRRNRPGNIIVQADRDEQYSSADYQGLLKLHNLHVRMSAKGCSYDNACAVSFFHSRKLECILGERFISQEIMWKTVFNYIECHYNRWGRYTYCGGLSPEQFENQNFGQCPIQIAWVGSVQRVLRIDFRDGYVLVNPGEAYVVLKGVDHKTSAKTTVKMMMIESCGVLNTGHEGRERTAGSDVWIKLSCIRQPGWSV